MKWKTLMIAAVMLAALFVTPASALEYTFDSPSTGDFGTPTSDETIYEWEDPNVDRSKSSALIPPGFGTPTSYLPNSGVYLTPNLAAGGPLNSPALTGTITSVGGGATVLPGAVDAPVSTYPTASYPTASAPATAAVAILLAHRGGWRYSSRRRIRPLISPPSPKARGIPLILRLPAAKYRREAEYSFFTLPPILPSTASSQDISISLPLRQKASQTRGLNQ